MSKTLRMLEKHALLPGPLASWLIRHGSIDDGFDPIPEKDARLYAEMEWRAFDPAQIDVIEKRIGGLNRKRVLDLGAGPGQCAIELAKRGAKVTWHDISRNFQKIAQEHAEEHNLELEFSLGYLEEADRFLKMPFDLVFSRICWYYCVDDAKFARIFHDLIRPGGIAFIDNYISVTGLKSKVRYKINAWTGVKIGHPPPPPGRLERLFKKYKDLEVEATTLTPRLERLFLTRKC